MESRTKRSTRGRGQRKNLQDSTAVNPRKTPMKVIRVSASNKKKIFVVVTNRGQYDFPFSRCESPPSSTDPIVHLGPDPELGDNGFTFRLRSGKEDSVLCDQILDYHSDPDYVRDIHLHIMSIQAQERIKEKRISKREVARALKTSPKQLYRLLDQAFYGKTIDQMLKLFYVLGMQVEFKIKKVA